MLNSPLRVRRRPLAAMGSPGMTTWSLHEDSRQRHSVPPCRRLTNRRDATTALVLFVVVLVLSLELWFSTKLYWPLFQYGSDIVGVGSAFPSSNVAASHLDNLLPTERQYRRVTRLVQAPPVDATRFFHLSVRSTSNSAAAATPRSVDSMHVCFEYEQDQCSVNVVEPAAPSHYASPHECQHADWHSYSFPTCNALHELGFFTTEQGTLLSTRGSWRSVWKYRQRHGGSITTDDDTVILKMLNFTRRPFSAPSFEYARIDALSMERLTRSNHVVGIFGYCGQSLLTEYAPTNARLFLKNKTWSSSQRLRVGATLAQAFADVHSIDDAERPTLAHNDVNLMNVVVDQHGKLKLNDFNIALLVSYNVSDGTSCENKNPVAFFEAPLWKSPQQIRRQTQYAAQDDIYGLGSLLFQVFTKHQPWTHLENRTMSMEDVTNAKINGQLPTVPKKYLHSGKPAMDALYFATMACFRYDPSERLTAHELVRNLHFVYSQLRQHNIMDREAIQKLFERETNDQLLERKRQEAEKKAGNVTAT